MLKNNIFQFNNLTFTQICGIAMGTKLSPALATIYIGNLEEGFIKNRPGQLLLCVQYLEDVNKTKDRIRFTANISTQSVDFLHLAIYKVPDFLTTHKLSTTIYYKPTGTLLFPLGSSYMSRHIHKGITIGDSQG